MKYLLDANAYIDAKDYYYRESICPGFWVWLDSASTTTFGSIDKVRDEILRGNDNLAKWFKQRRGASWVAATTSDATQKQFQKVADWVNNSDATIPVKNNFLRGADPWLVAHALATGAQVVTLEAPKQSPKKVSLSDTCAAFRVPVLKTWELLEIQEVRFEWSK